MTEEDIKNLTLDDIVRWVVINSDDSQHMEKLNQLTFTFTKKYKEFTK